MKTSFYFFSFLLLLIFCLGCSKKFNYTNIQKVPNSDTYVATGFFTNDPIPLLVNNPKWLSINTPMPDNAYLFLSGSALDSVIISPDSTRLYGAFVTLRGTEDKQNSEYDKYKKKVLNVESIEVNGNSTSDRGPYIIAHCQLTQSTSTACPTPPPFCEISTPSLNKFALLFSGGKEEPQAKFRYWNDLEFMYLTLRSQYGFSDENIAVLYMDKRTENPSSEMIVDYSANVDGLNAAIAYLKNKMDGFQDTLFIFVTNHGGGFDPNFPNELSGTEDNGSDEADAPTNPPTPMYDENIAYYKPAGSDYLIKDDMWRSKWNTILNTKHPVMIAVYEQCFSGGFLRDMAGPNRVNIAAAPQNGPSFALLPNNVYDAFSYFFTAALHGRHANGDCLIPSPDNEPQDDNISIFEAYKYAHSMDPGPTHRHFIDDLGNGVGVEGVPVVSFQGTGPGIMSKALFLK